MNNSRHALYRMEMGRLDSRIRFGLLFTLAFVLYGSGIMGFAKPAAGQEQVDVSERSPVTITVDGVSEIGESAEEESPDQGDKTIRADGDLEERGIQLRVDRLGGERRLATWSQPEVAVPDEPVVFYAYDNYDAFIERREIRIFEASHSLAGLPLEVIPLDATRSAEWPGLALAGRNIIQPNLVYVLRVYGARGHFDETEPRPLPVVAPGHADWPVPASEATRQQGYGESNLAVAGIPVSSGTVTLNGQNLPSGTRISVFGRPVPIGPEGRFVFEELLPPGEHSIPIRVLAPNTEPELIVRAIEIPQTDWFHIGLIDVTVGQNRASGRATSVLQDERYDGDVFVDSRLAFFVQGRFNEDWRLTAAADTREERYQDIIKNFDNKNPFQLLRRLDPDRHYPTYGDDSLTREEAPTQGRFYAKLERRGSHLLWGSFATDVTATDFAQVDRGLYGAKLHLESDQLTSFQEPLVEVDGFAADPGTVAARDEFRGTGGSLFYLRRPNITAGSERLRVEVRDQVTGLVLETTELRPFDDYDLDPIQGRVILTNPLSSTADDRLVVRSGNLAGNPVYLVATYEFTPGLDDIDDYAYGGQAGVWLGDYVRLGATGSREGQESGDVALWGSDITLRAGAGTYLKGEFARTFGEGVGALNSFDGGFNFEPRNGSQVDSGTAEGWRIEGAFDLRDLDTEGWLRGTGSGYYQTRERGFAAPGQLAQRDVDQWGTRLDLELGAKTELRGQYDESQEATGIESRRAELDLARNLDEHWKLTLGVRSDETDRGASFSTFESQDEGRRTDAALELLYAKTNWDVYGFGQSTLERTGSRTAGHRGGLGGHYRLTERLDLGAEASGGTEGFGAKATSEIFVTERSSLYLGYELDPDRSDIGRQGGTGLLTGGLRTRWNDFLSVYGEERYQHGRGPVGLTHSFGIDWTPEKAWSLGISAEFGEIDDPQQGELDRKSGTLSLGYRLADFDIGAALELRRDKSRIENRNSLLFRSNASYKINPDWRALARFNLSESDSSQGSFFDGNFKEAVLGFAYRPVYHEKLNALFKYTYFENLPSSGQVARDDQILEFQQRSHVLALDTNYDLSSQVTVGVKYAYRLGELRDARTDAGQWFESAAHLVILRGDFHVVHNWDVVTEGRWLFLPDADQDRSGTLLALYRHFFGVFKAGVGYNFTDFSDDLTDTSFDSHGWFFNVVGKF